MATELEQKFYDTFGIKQRLEEKAICQINNLVTCEHCIYYKKGKCKSKIIYPNITAEKLLELICILNKHYAENFQCATMLVGDTTEKIKECILKDCIEQSQHIKPEIQQLFKD